MESIGRKGEPEQPKRQTRPIFNCGDAVVHHSSRLLVSVSRFAEPCE